MEEETKTTQEPENPQNDTPPRQASRIPRPSPVLSIDGRLGVETEADKALNSLLDLVESLKSRRILTGTVEGIERGERDPEHCRAVLYHRDFKVIIPAEEMVELPEDLRGRPQGDVFFDLLNKRMGAEVDYVVKGLDAKAGVAAASRLEAMDLKRREYYLTPDREGNYRLYGGVCAEGRVVSVIRPGIFVDLFGVEVYIPLAELSYQRMLDATAAFQAGQRVLVKILAIDRTDRTTSGCGPR